MALGEKQSDRNMHNLLCGRRDFRGAICRFAERYPESAWHLNGTHNRIYDVLAAAARYIAADTTIVDLGCLPANIPIGFHVAGLLSNVEYIGTCIETEDDPQYRLAVSLGVKLQRVNLDPHFSLFPEVAELPDRVDLSDGMADVVLMTEVLEHLAWPHSILEEASRLLRPGGVVVGTTPNATNAGSMMKSVLGLGTGEWYENSHLASKTWMKHIRFYTFRDIRMLFKAHGLGLILERYRSYADLYSVRGVAGKTLRAIRSLFHIIPHWREKLLFVAVKPRGEDEGRGYSA